MFRFVFSLLALMALPLAAQAQDRPNTILVLDASGSMWGQIDGVAKITIAQDVVTGLLQTLPDNQSLGLTVYGHRRRGDCADIETVVAPAPGTRDEIAAAVAAIQPLGKTPMTDAVIAAAESLRYTEEAATVILVSDGVETCNPDPCAAARALEQAGINFTAHVIGFDITDPEALRQMQCIADETGGRFLTAANASELTAALADVAVAPEPEPVPLPQVAFLATAGEADRDISAAVTWEITGPEGTVTLAGADAARASEFAVGSYTARAYWTEAETEADASFIAQTGSQTVTVHFDEPLPGASVSGPASAVAGSTVAIDWTGPDEPLDHVSVAEPADRDTTYANYAYTERGNPAQLVMPVEPGSYQLRYVRNEGGTVLATAAIEVTPVTATLTAPDAAAAGAVISVDWTGPDYDLDYIAIALPGERDYINYSYARNGQPLDLTMPADPGSYELRYVMNQGATVLATRPIEATKITGQLVAPAEAEAGSTVTVGWDGPGYERDYIAVARPGERSYVNYTYVQRGNPLELLMPADPGDYELRYVLSQDESVLVRQAIRVTPVSAQLTGPDSAIAGATVQVGWSGPDYERDYIAVARPGERGYINYTYTRQGNPLGLEMPTEAGTYEIRYVLAQGEQVMATRPITIEPLKVGLTGPAEAAAGATVQIGWDGPDYERDFISVGQVGEDDYLTYTYTQQGNPLGLQMPSTPGNYEIRYQINQGNEIKARIPITVTDVKAQLVAQPTISLSAGRIMVGWDGPGYERDYLAIAVPGEDRYLTYEYTQRGNPIDMELPPAAGNYEIRYVMNQDARILGRIPLTVTAD